MSSLVSTIPAISVAAGAIVFSCLLIIHTMQSLFDYRILSDEQFETKNFANAVTINRTQHVLTMRVTYDGSKMFQSASLKFGGSGKGDCVDLAVFANNPVGVLTEIEYNAGCSITPSNPNVNTSFARGQTSTLLRGALICVRRFFPFVTILRFDDKSHVPCDDVEVMLAPQQILVYGKTWYERRFAATIENETAYMVYRNKTDALKSENSMMPWHIFQTYGHISPEFQKLYDESPSYWAFFEAVRKWTLRQQPPMLFCKATWPWLERFLYDYYKYNGACLLNMTWTMPVTPDGQTNSNVTVKIVQVGGKTIQVGGKTRSRNVNAPPEPRRILRSTRRHVFSESII